MKILVLFIFLFGITKVGFGQDSTTHSSISSKYFDAVAEKSQSVSGDIDKKTQKTLERLQKQEAKLQKKLAKIDSLAANNIFSNSAEKYKELQDKLSNKAAKLTQYIPKLDSFSTSLKFLEEHPELINNIKDAKEKLGDVSDKLKEFQSKLQGAEEIKKILKERKEYLKQQLEKFGFAKELKKINKEVYYYGQQLQELREAFKDSKKAERKALELLSKTKLFKDFMKKNSILASLFRMPGDVNDPNYTASLAGLQTRAQVNSMIQNQIAAGGANAQQAFSQNIQQAQSQLQGLKNKLNKWGKGSSGDIMPEGFRPNEQRTKKFVQRLEFGSSIQTQGARYMFPITSDISMMLGFKPNDKSVVGIGASYKLGWGTGWNNIKITHQGIGLKSYVDLKLKGSFWLSGGYEQNFRSALNGILIPSPFGGSRVGTAWQQSGLIGISKVVSVKSKLFKKTKAQLLWDFLSYQQVPKAQAIVFRVGYNFR